MRNIEIFDAYADCEADDFGAVDAVITVVVREIVNGGCYYKTLHISTIKLISDEEDTSCAYISEDHSWVDEEFEDAYLLVRTALNVAVEEENDGRCLEYIEGKRLQIDLSNMSQGILEQMM